MLRNCYKALCLLGHSQAGLGAGRRLRPIHHRGDGEAAGEWGGCGGDWGHWRFWIGWGWEVGEFIRNGGEVWPLKLLWFLMRRI